MSDVNYKVTGFLKNERIKQGQAIKPKSLISMFDGRRLDEIDLQATIKTQKEIDSLINFLQTSRPCF